ncbi:MAG TPA: hypothetical protein VFE62_27145, partial [Gemmataceae bacterium]|nr:hypothetical protein [Gemmataceae bacterium]
MVARKITEKTFLSFAGEWLLDNETWRDTEGGKWIVKTVCAKLHAVAYFGAGDVNAYEAYFCGATPPDPRWYALENKDLVVMLTQDDSVPIDGKIRAKLIGVPRPFPFQGHVAVYNLEDVQKYLKKHLDRTSLTDGAWDKPLGGILWTDRKGNAWGASRLINSQTRDKNETRHQEAVLHPPDLKTYGKKAESYKDKPAKGSVRYLELDWPGGTSPTC